MSLTKLSLAGYNYIFLAKESLVCDILAWDGKIGNLFTVFSFHNAVKGPFGWALWFSVYLSTFISFSIPFSSNLMLSY
jgi:hypothetical protein